MLMLDHALPGIPGGPGGPGGPMMPLYSDPETQREGISHSWYQGLCLHLKPHGQMPLLGLTSEQGEELLIGSSREARGTLGTWGARKPNADPRTWGTKSQVAMSSDQARGRQMQMPCQRGGQTHRDLDRCGSKKGRKGGRKRGRED